MLEDMHNNSMASGKQIELRVCWFLSAFSNAGKLTSFIYEDMKQAFCKLTISNV